MESREDCLREAAECDRLAGLANTHATRALLGLAAFQWRKLAEKGSGTTEDPRAFGIENDEFELEQARAVSAHWRSWFHRERSGPAQMHPLLCGATLVDAVIGITPSKRSLSVQLMTHVEAHAPK
jgi:hypothetical protein